MRNRHSTGPIINDPPDLEEVRARVRDSKHPLAILAQCHHLADMPLFVVSVKKRQLTMAPLSALSADAGMQPGIPIAQEHVEASKSFVRPVADLVGKTCLTLLA